MPMMRKFLYFGLGALSLTRDKAEKIMNEMVDKGEINKDEAKQFVDDAIKRGTEEKEELRKMIKQEYEEIKSQLSFVSKKDLEALEARIKALEDRIQGV
ncbi:MAG: phasin family protein [Syntrophomonadaceae bacterium]|jgi:polyhydroxyalkanoate synthesis regulator phasin